MSARLKTAVMNALGESPVAWAHAFRFIYLLGKGKPDPEVRLLPRFLRPGDVAVDVGANGANWTVALGDAVRPNGRVFAFEADPYYALVTGRTLKLLRRRDVVFFPFGLSERDETVSFRTLDEDGQRLSGRSGVDPGSQPGSKGMQTVQLRRLDGLSETHPELLRCRFIKCDVEGYELFVFRGASGIIDAARPVVVLEAGDFAPHGYTAADLHGFFKARNYLAFGLNSHGRLAPTDEHLQVNDPASVNRLLIPAEEVSRISDLQES